MTLFDVPEMIQIGAAGRNSGKTTLACLLIETISRRETVVAVKVTTIDHKDGACPRGGQGCGVCTSIDSNYLLTEELDGPPRKDTVRLLNAGASRVFWLRVLRSYLAEAAAELLQRTGRGSPIVCESNSLRHAVSPGMFLITRQKGAHSFKKTARDVREFADRIVDFDGTGFEPDSKDIDYLDGKWYFREPATAIILAGGMSGRMGRDKSFLLIDGRPLIERIYRQVAPLFDEVIISANDPEKYAFLGARVIPDRVRAQGPLMGIASAMEASQTDLNFVVACDIPDIEVDLIRRLLSAAAGADGAVLAAADGKIEPLFAAYRKGILGTLNRHLESGQRRIRTAFEGCDMRRVVLEPGRTSLFNLNTPPDLEAYENRPASEQPLNAAHWKGMSDGKS